MGVGKLAKSKQLLGVAVAGILLTVIFVPFQQAEAFTVTVELPNATGANNEITSSIAGEPFEIKIDVAPGELISVQEVTLILDNGEASVKNAVFDSLGELDSGDNNLVINNEIVISAQADGGYAYGFGTVTDGVTGPTGYSFSFLSTEDYIGGNNVDANEDGITDFVIGLLGPGTITITGTLRTADLADGVHTLDVVIDTGANTGSNDFITFTPPFEFEIVEDTTVVVTETNVPPASTTANIATTDSNNNPINIKLNFGNQTTNNGNAVVTVQSVDDFGAGKTAGQLAQQGFTQSGSQLQFTTDDDDNEFIAVGFIMDIDLSALGLPPGTLVTLEMDYDDTGLSSSEENRVRLMHQLDTLDEWEALTNDDPTINGGNEVDTTNNIVYGTTDDFSLFGPAVREAISTGGGSGGGGGGGGGGHGGGGGGGGTVVITWPTVETKDDAYFLEHPLERVLVANSAFVNAGGVSINAAEVGQQVSISGEFTNYQGKQQTYAYIVQVINENDEVVSLAWQQGTLASGSSITVSTLWTPEASGDYEVKIFVWNSITGTPEPLSTVTVKNISVSS